MPEEVRAPEKNILVSPYQQPDSDEDQAARSMSKISSVVQKLSKAMASDDEGTTSSARKNEELNAVEFAAINEAYAEEDDITLVPNQAKKGNT